VLGAYPSALHVAWTPPTGLGRRVQALPVFDEPTPFWDGADARGLLETWRSAVGFDSTWGSIELAASDFNGSSGRPIELRYLGPLGVTRQTAWITDCLDTYRASEGVSRAISSVYAPVARQLGLPGANLGPHPDELDVMREAKAEHADRLLGEITTCSPDILVTLGNAALAVLWSLPGVVPMRSDPPTSLNPRDYGRPCDIRVGRRRMTLWALGHPNVLRLNDAYAAAHDQWITQPTVGARLGRC